MRSALEGLKLEFEKQYDEEAYLFGVVGPKFRKEGRLRAYDFFLIVRWKANRAISKVARRVLSVGGPDLEKAISQMTGEVRSGRADVADAFRRPCALAV